MPKHISTVVTLQDTESAIRGRRADFQPDTWRKMISGVKRVPEFLGRPLGQIKADRGAVAVELERVVGDRWGEFGFKKKKSWQNVVYSILQAIDGGPKRKVRGSVGRPQMVPEWQEFFARVDNAIENGDLPEHTLIRVRCLTGWANGEGLAPDQVDQAAFDRLLEQRRRLANASLSSSPNGYAATYLRAAQAWNGLRGTVLSDNVPALDWQRREDGYLALDQLAPELQDEIQKLFAKLQRKTVQISGADHDAKLAVIIARAKASKSAVFKHLPATEKEAQEKARPPVSKHHIHSLSKVIRATVTAMVTLEPDLFRIADIRSLSDVASEVGMAMLLLELKRRIACGLNRDKTKTRLTMGDHLVDIAKNWVGRPEAELEDMRDLLRDSDINVGSGGMTPRRREAVDAMLEDDACAKWLSLPETLWMRVESALDRGDEFTAAEVSLAEVALMSSIFRVLPMRLKNMALLRFGCNDATLNISGNPRHPETVNKRRSMTIRISHGESKSSGIACRVDQATADRILTYCSKIRPTAIRLNNATDNQFLFPGNGSVVTRIGLFNGCRHVGALGDAFSRRMDDEGIGRMTAHMARHVTASLLIRADDRNLPLVAMMLGDTVKTTAEFYVSNDQIGASIRFQKLMARHVAVFKGLWTHGDKEDRNAA